MEEMNGNPTRVCPNCNEPMEEGQAFCTKCGAARVVEKKNVCSKCGTELAEGQEFCSKCGQKVNLTIEPNVNSAINQFNANVNMNNQRKSNKPVIMGIVGVVIAIVVIGIIASITAKPKINLKDVYRQIGGDGYYCKLASDASYITIDTNPLDLDDSFSSSAWTMVKSANKELGFSDALENRMNRTRFIDGRQTEENDIARVSWTYHPDKGLEVTYELKKNK